MRKVAKSAKGQILTAFAKSQIGQIDAVRSKFVTIFQPCFGFDRTHKNYLSEQKFERLNYKQGKIIGQKFWCRVTSPVICPNS